MTLDGKVIARPVIDESTGEIIADVNSELSTAVLDKAKEAGISEISVIFFDGLAVGPYLRNTLLVDKVNTKEESLHRDLQASSPRRAAHDRCGYSLLQALILRSRNLRFVGSWSLEDQSPLQHFVRRNTG